MARVVFLFCFYFLVSQTVSPANAALKSNLEGKWHTLEIGFNLTFPDRIPLQEKGLSHIAEIGIRHVRIYEIFDGKSGITYQKRLKKALDVVLRNGMIPMLSVSNVPADLMPNEQERKKNKKILPPTVADKVEKVLQYSNRFPPVNFHNYREKLQELVGFLFKTYGRDQVVQWRFEIGNEPDAPLYYWGKPDQFAEIAEIIIQIFKKNGIHNIGGYGVTQNAIYPRKSKLLYSKHYGELVYNIVSNSNMGDYEFISFHQYQRDDQQVHEGPLHGLPEWLRDEGNRVMITEWNVSWDGRKALKVFRKPGAWGEAFAELLVDCHRNSISSLYLFKLMDYSLISSLQLGAFDRKGVPKTWFQEFTAIWKVIRNGYKIQMLSDRGILIQGRGGDKFIVAGTKPISVDMDYFLLTYTSHGDRIRERGKISIGEWAVLRRIEKVDSEAM